MKRLFPLLLSFLILTFPTVAMADTTPTATTTVPVQRIYGQDRYQTATAVADQLAQQWGIDYSKGQQFQAVVLASGNNWPDAISGTPLAGHYKAPILLLDTTPTSAGSQTTWNYIQAHVAKTGKVFVLGGTGVLPQTFTDYLVNMGFSQANIQQIGGKDRDATSLMIAQMLNKSGLYLVTDQNFYDALTVGSAAASDSSDMAILLVSPNGFTQPGEKTFVDSKWILTEGDLTKSIMSFYPRAAQYASTGGSDEYSNNRNFLRYESESPVIYLATGEDYPDALTGALLAGTEFTTLNRGTTGVYPIVLVRKATLPSDSSAIINTITYEDKMSYERLTAPPVHYSADYPNPKLVVLGGPGAVSDSVVNQVVQIMSGSGKEMYN